MHDILASLRAAVGGPVLTPAQDGYRAEIAGFDLAQDHRPPIAVSAATVSDVVATLQRHDYNVKYYHGEELYRNELQTNLEHLMNYLSI